MENVKLAEEFLGKGVVGIDFSGNPFKGSFSDFVPALQQARKAKLPITLHFAEKDDKQESLAMLNFKPERLGHACYLDDDIIETMLKLQIPLEICLTSNVITKSCEGYASHNFGIFRAKNYPMNIATDDKGVFKTSLSKEYELLAKAFKLNKRELLEVSKGALPHIFRATREEMQLLRGAHYSCTTPFLRWLLGRPKQEQQVKRAHTKRALSVN